ncbi:MAG: hypothetical protein IJA82_04560 [Clostridia bacterium]|nr:hypothetical protein [Clostridia bacterium]
MNCFYEHMSKYGLHDCMINEIWLDNRQIKFNFPLGVYKLNDSGKETELTEACTMNIDVDNSTNLDNHIQVNKIRKNKIESIEFDQFVQLIKKSNFDIDINFYSPFCNTILLKGYIEKYMYELTISEITQMFFVFSSYAK